MIEKRRYINPFLDRAKQIQRNENDPEFNPLVDDTPEGTADIEDLDDWMKEMAEKENEK